MVIGNAGMVKLPAFTGYRTTSFLKLVQVSPFFWKELLMDNWSLPGMIKSSKFKFGGELWGDKK